MKTTRVTTGSAQGKGASMMMSKASAIAEKTRQLSIEKMDDGEQGHVRLRRQDANFKIGQTKVDGLGDGPIALENTCPMPIDKVDEHVYIGNKFGAEELTYLKNNGITHVLNTANELPNYHEQRSGIRYLHLSLNDDPTPHVENLLKVLEPSNQFIINAIASNPRSKILVHCAAGISRSASVVIYYLMKKHSIGFDDALKMLKSKRLWVKPNEWYESQLRDAQTIIENETGKLL